MCRVTPPRLCLWLLAIGTVVPVFAAKPVAAVGKANSNYLERRLVDGKPKRETYVFMEGNRLEGASRDRTFERTTFREIAEFLAPELTDRMASVLRNLGSERAWVVHAEDGLDELSTLSPTRTVPVPSGSRFWPKYTSPSRARKLFNVLNISGCFCAVSVAGGSTASP